MLEAVSDGAAVKRARMNHSVSEFASSANSDDLQLMTKATLEAIALLKKDYDRYAYCIMKDTLPY